MADVSVVIPAFNEAARIGAAIEDALAQTLPPLEILVADDGSTDATAAIAETYPHVRVLRGPRSGISAARNRAMRAARGAWIALLDADDRWRPERLAELERAAAAAPGVDFIFSDYVVTEAGRANASSNLARTTQFVALERVAVATDVTRIARSALADALAVGNFIGTSTVSVRTSLVRDVAFDESLPERTAAYQVSEDVEWYLRLLRATDALAIDRVLGSYERRPGTAAAAHGRVRHGDVKLGERIARQPESYAPGAARAFAERRREHQRHAATIHLRAAEFGPAASVLREALHERFALVDAALLVLALAADRPLGRAGARRLRNFWRARPGVRR